MSFQGRSLDEREAASIVAGLHSNNIVTGSGVGRAGVSGGGGKSKKRVRDNLNNTVADEEHQSKKKPAVKPKAAAAAAKKEPPMDATGLVFAQPELKPAPYFYYTDHSLEQDDDPLTPITAAGSVPTFPAKMHAILTNPELADVVGWAPHGRSWLILKPRDFEIRVLPKYFEHSKFSSFVRQANGWGFRRMSQGYDKNAYYHEYFLRAMPWLCKKMRRPKVAEKKAVDPEMEPDLDAISRQLPVVDRPPTREVLVLQKTIELGPKARMPVLWDTGTPPAAPSSPVRMPEAPPEVENLPTLNHSRSYGDLKPAALPTNPPPPPPAAPVPQDAGPIAANALLTMGNSVPANVQQFSAAASMPTTSNQNNLNTHTAYNNNNYAAAAAAPPSIPPNSIPPSASSGNLASDSNFAAGFMAATAYHSTQIRNMFGSAFAAGMPIPDAAGMVNPANLESALSLLQRAGMGHQMMAQPNMHHPHQAPTPAPAAMYHHAASTPAAALNHHQGVNSAASLYCHQGNNTAPSFNHHQAAPPAASLHRHQAAPPAVAPAAAINNLSLHGASNSRGSQSSSRQPASLSERAMQRLQKFQAYQAQGNL